MPDHAGLHALLVDRSRTSVPDAAVAEAFDLYMGALEIHPGWFDVLAVTTWVERALRRERQLVDAGSSREERDNHNFGVRYVEALASVWHPTPSRVTQEAGVP
jgi:hypothetical protein